MNTFVIADPHLGHKRIMEYESRGFKDTDTMDNHIIDCFNEIVSENDIFYIVGDFALTGADKTIDYIRRLNGVKYLVRGNHDNRGYAWYLRNGFKDVQNYYVIGKYFLCHYPLIEINKTYLKGKYDILKKALEESECKYIIHGHSHRRDPVLEMYGNRINVCIDIIGCRPVILEGIEKRGLHLS